MVTVYFIHERTWHTEEVAKFASEEIYMACVPALEAEAKKWGGILSESVEYKED